MKKSTYFETRAPHTLHKVPIVKIGSGDEPENIYTGVFRHHVVDRPQSAQFHSEGGVMTKEKITALFHASHFEAQIFQYYQGRNLISEDDFVKTVTETAVTRDTVAAGRVGPNRVFVLIGKVGTGKTTLVSHVLVKYRMLFKNRAILAFRVDVEKLAGAEISGGKFFSGLLSRIVQEICEEYAGDTRFWQARVSEWESVPDGLDEDASTMIYCMRIKQICLEVYKRYGRTMTMFLDNMDRYYYLFDRSSFSEEGGRRRFESMGRLTALIGEFDGGSGKLDGSGLNVLTVMRRHTLDYIIAGTLVLPTRRLDPNEDGSGIFRLAETTPLTIVSSRIALLKRCLTLGLTGWQKSETQRNIAFIESIWRSVLDPLATKGSRRIMINDLSKLMHHGHRALVDHLSGYKWVMSNPLYFQRIFKTYAPAILMFMLRGRAKYSQSETRFPNLFLVRGDAERPTDIYVPEGLVAPHKQTYWLKYILCSYIRQRQEKGLSVSARDLEAIFSGDGDGFYEPHIVQLVLGSLSQTDASAMTELVYGTALDGLTLTVREVKLTPRGIFLLDRFSFDFTYLQLVVEDHMLEVPDFLIDEFSFDPSDTGYTYLVEQDDTYSDRSSEMIVRKSRQVAIFLKILEVSYKFEARRYKDTFALLSGRKFRHPNFEQIRRDILLTLTNLDYSLRGKGILGRANEAFIVADGLENQLHEFFEDAYEKQNV